jgi:hypothetical protein
MVESADCIFDRPHHIRNMIFLGRGPRIWRGEASLPLCAACLCAAKVTAAGNSHVFGLYHRQPRKLFESQYMDDTDKVPWEGFPVGRLLRRKWGGAFHLHGHILTTTLPARSS